MLIKQKTLKCTVVSNVDAHDLTGVVLYL
jgi:hypothetical protein